MEDQYKLQDEISLFALIDDIRAEFKWGLLVAVGLFFAASVYTIVFLIPSFTVSIGLTAVSEQKNSKIRYINMQLLQFQKLSADGLNGIKLATNYNDEFFNDIAEMIALDSNKISFYKSIRKENNESIYNFLHQSSLSDDYNINIFLSSFRHYKNRVDFSNDLSVFDQVLLEEVLRLYIGFVVDKYKSNYQEVIKASIENISNINEAVILSSYKIELSKRIAELKKAILISSKIKHEDFYKYKVVLTNDSPLYLLGESVLQVELEVLQNKIESSELYNDIKPSIDMHRDYLEKIDINLDDVKMINIGDAEVKQNLISKNKILILAFVVSIVLGIMTSLFIAAARRYYKDDRK